MTVHDDKWLDEQIRKVVDGEAPEFDAEQWKKTFSHEYTVLRSRSSEGHLSAPRQIRLFGRKGLLVRLAVAAVIIFGSVVLLSRFSSDEQSEEKKPDLAKRTVAEMLTLGSLRSAYARGGLDAVETQFEDVSQKLGTRPGALSMRQQFVSSDG